MSNELPQLPKPNTSFAVDDTDDEFRRIQRQVPLYTADQMREYAIACLAAAPKPAEAPPPNPVGPPTAMEDCPKCGALCTTNDVWAGGIYQHTNYSAVPPPAAQAAGASMEPVAWRARSLVWEPDGPNWCDPNHGFYITDSEKDDGILLDGERAFRAAWGEGEVYGFDTLDEAKAWCQQLQRWLDENIEPATSIPLTAPVAAISAGDVAETRVTPEMLADAFQMDRAGGRYYLTEYGQDASNGPMRGVVFYDAAAIKDVAALLTAALRRCTCCPGSDVCAARQRSNT
jgi:hypothetical protein